MRRTRGEDRLRFLAAEARFDFAAVAFEDPVLAFTFAVEDCDAGELVD